THVALLRTAGRVVDATPNRILHPEAVGVRFHKCHDPVPELDALFAAGVGDHDVESQTVGVPRQRIGPAAADFAYLGKSRTDGARGQDGPYLQAPLRRDSNGQESRINPQSRCRSHFVVPATCSFVGVGIRQWGGRGDDLRATRSILVGSG